ncbi:MAG: hypothetical protein Q8O76_07920 [Chloroflexota bacterium]|nr:hypothetical protein [Chloroflexota bacterium]
MVQYYRPEEKAKLRRQRTKDAIAMAMQSRWEEAVTANRGILEVFPTDLDAYNRLGKALTELGRCEEAMEAYKHSLEIDPINAIARRNLERLSHLKESPVLAKDSRSVDPKLFLAETGKTEITELKHLAPRGVLAKVAAGDQVELKKSGRELIAENGAGEYLGLIEPRLGLRLIKLMEGGNRYTAAIARSTQDSLRIIIKEVYQDPSHAGRPSFPAKVATDFRSYVKESIIKHETEEEPPGDESEEFSAWEEESKELPDDVHIVGEGVLNEGDEGEVEETQ